MEDVVSKSVDDDKKKKQNFAVADILKAFFESFRKATHFLAMQETAEKIVVLVPVMKVLAGGLEVGTVEIRIVSDIPSEPCQPVDLRESVKALRLEQGPGN
jgi:hypothetical protein